MSEQLNFEQMRARNRHAWDIRAAVHKDTNFYDVAGFRAGKEILNSIELERVGAVSGKRLLHLQCHFGMDTLAWARHGAQVTGVDFSPEAIRLARELSAETQLEAEFICADVYELEKHIHTPFELVFASYGVIGWLPDLAAWARQVAQATAAGGRFVLVEFHPLVWMFDNDFERVAYSYFNTETIAEVSEGTYADANAPIRTELFSWNHPISEVVQSLLNAGFALQHIAEYDYSPYGCFKPAAQIEVSPNRWQLRGYENNLPMVYALEMVRLG